MKKLRRSVCAACAHRESLSGESGQSLFLIIAALIAVFVIAALAVDLSARYEEHHRAQVAADAGALAGAQNLSTGTAAAATDAQAYAVGGATAETTAHGVTVTTPGSDPGGTATVQPIGATDTTVTVTVTHAAPSFFGGIVSAFFSHFGLGSTVSATATASEYSGPGAPYGLFANSTSCSAISFSGNINGSTGMHSNGGISTNGNVPLTDTSNSSYSNSSCHNEPSNATSVASESFPIDYSTGSANSTLTSACSGSAGYHTASSLPSGWTANGTTWTWNGPGSVPSGVYCNTSGTITISNNASSASGGVTFYAQTVSLGNGDNLSGYLADPAGSSQKLLAYQTGNTALDFPGNGTLTGVLFYPNAEMTFAGTSYIDGFVEADTIDMKGTVTATGPPDQGGGSSGCCALTQ